MKTNEIIAPSYTSSNKEDFKKDIVNLIDQCDMSYPNDPCMFIFAREGNGEGYKCHAFCIPKKSTKNNGYLNSVSLLDSSFPPMVINMTGMLFEAIKKILGMKIFL